MNPGGPNSATLAPVVSGQAGLGQFSGVSQLLLARSAGAPVRLFATGYQQAPFAYFSLPRAPVHKPEDLYGKRIGIQPTARATLDALIAKAKLDPAKLNISTMGFDMTPLATGQLDVVTGWITNTQALAVIGPRADHDDGERRRHHRSRQRLFRHRTGARQERRSPGPLPDRGGEGLGLCPRPSGRGRRNHRQGLSESRSRDREEDHPARAGPFLRRQHQGKRLGQLQAFRHRRRRSISWTRSGCSRARPSRSWTSR